MGVHLWSPTPKGWSVCQCWKHRVSCCMQLQGLNSSNQRQTQMQAASSGDQQHGCTLKREQQPAAAVPQPPAAAAAAAAATAASPPAPASFRAAAVALDVEFSHLLLQDGSQLALPTWLAAVDEQGQLLLKTYIQPHLPPGARFFGGVPPDALASAPPLPEVLQQLTALLSGRLLVGHGLAKDMASLGLQHPEHMRFDTMTHPAFCNKAGNSRSLKQLAQQFLGQRIQSAPLPGTRQPQRLQQQRQQGRTRPGKNAAGSAVQQLQPQAERFLHDPEEDAAAVMQLYQEVVLPSSYEGQVAAATQQLLEEIRQRQLLQQHNDDRQ